MISKDTFDLPKGFLSYVSLRSTITISGNREMKCTAVALIVTPMHYDTPIPWGACLSISCGCFMAPQPVMKEQC